MTETIMYLSKGYGYFRIGHPQQKDKMMTRLERAKLPWECIFGKKSHINLLGKILLFPFLAILATVISILELLFSKDVEATK